jgi:penicillin-binding protein 2
MIISAAFRDNNPRLPVFAGMIGFGLLVLLFWLFRVQVLKAELYGNRGEAQSLRRIRIPSARGEIVDRNGIVLANNRPSYDVAIYLDQLGQTSKRQNLIVLATQRLLELGAAMNLPVPLTERDIRLHFQRRRPLPLTVWKDLSPQQVAMFEERASHLPGIDLVATPVRQYPQGSLAAHTLGHVSKQPHKEVNEEEEFNFSQPDTFGKMGVELAYDELLHGEPGGRTIRVNPSGRTVENVAVRPPERGARVTLTLDSRLQKIVEEALAHTQLPAGKELRGAAVLLDPRTGEVLAMASLPAFDPNVFNPGSPAALVNAALSDPARRMFNRASDAQYAPGSTFKPISMLAGLDTGKSHVSDTVVCTGEMKIGNWERPFRCWNRQGHGRVDGMTAMRESCDIWFYQHGMAMGVDAIARYAREFGLGRETGLDIKPDKPGLVPTPSWKRMKYNEGWRDGDTATLAMGQSYLLTTPLQMAVAVAAIANAGTVWQPFVVKQVHAPTGEMIDENQPTARHRVEARPQNIEQIRQSMLGAVNSSDGTGNAAALRGVNVAGKTGTAEFDLFENGQRHRINRAWFIGFAPYENPQLALAILIEDGASGGHTAAPVAGKIFSQIFGKSLVRNTGSGD